MLYDRKWDVMSLNTLIAWLQTKPNNERYSYTDCQGCLLYQYFEAHGIDVLSVTHLFYREGGWGNECIKFLPPTVDQISHCSTFGEALNIALKIREKQHVG
jgi:hypothetical protein